MRTIMSLLFIVSMLFAVPPVKFIDNNGGKHVLLQGGDVNLYVDKYEFMLHSKNNIMVGCKTAYISISNKDRSGNVNIQTVVLNGDHGTLLLSYSIFKTVMRRFRDHESVDIYIYDSNTKKEHCLSFDCRGLKEIHDELFFK